MQSLIKLGNAVAQRRHTLDAKQGLVAKNTGIIQESLSRFERNEAAELEIRTPIAVRDVFRMGKRFSERAASLHANMEHAA